MPIVKISVERSETYELPKGVWTRNAYIIEYELQPNENIEDARISIEMLLSAWLKEQKAKLQKNR